MDNITGLIQDNWKYFWGYFAIGVPIALLAIIFYFKNKERLATALVALVNWTRRSMEVDGRPDPVKIICFLYANCRIIVTTTFCVKIVTLGSIKSTEAIWHIVVGFLGVLIITDVCILMLQKIILPQTLVELKNGISASTVKDFIKTENKDGVS